MVVVSAEIGEELNAELSKVVQQLETAIRENQESRCISPTPGLPDPTNNSIADRGMDSDQQKVYFWFAYDLDRSTMHPRFDLTGVRTHNLPIMDYISCP